MRHIIPFLFLIVIVTSCYDADKDFRKVQSEINDVAMKEFDKTISDDSFMGRAPFTPSEHKTVNFLIEELQKHGFEPPFKAEDGTMRYCQQVPLIAITSDVKSSMPGVALHSSRPVEKIELNNLEMVFCGFGIVAPEYGYDSYKGVDVKGKVAIVLINDPGLYLSQRGDTLQPDYFKGRELTYYGRWTYKFEEAARQGAAGVIIVHDELGAGYNYSVASRSSQMANLYIDTPDLLNNCAVEGWMTAEQATTLFLKEGYDITLLRNEACSKDFKSFSLKSKIHLHVYNTMKHNVSQNVAGIMRGSELPEETVVVTGHWDHFGVDNNAKPDADGQIDSIYNGAVDNATTMAWAFEIGRAYASLEHRPARSLMLLFPTSEEQGLLGSKYYVEHPAIAMDKTVACINNDMMYPRGQMKDLMIIGRGYYPQLDSLYEAAAKYQGRYVTSDPNAHTGLFFRSDQLSFHRKGVPSSWAFGCYDSRINGKQWASDSWDTFIKEIYHTVNDDYDPNWDWGGIVEDTKVAFEVIYRLTSSDNPFPKQE